VLAGSINQVNRRKKADWFSASTSEDAITWSVFRCSTKQARHHYFLSCVWVARLQARHRSCCGAHPLVGLKQSLCGASLSKYPIRSARTTAAEPKWTCCWLAHHNI
jgi:hypothetical protein